MQVITNRCKEIPVAEMSITCTDHEVEIDWPIVDLITSLSFNDVPPPPPPLPVVFKEEG